MRSFDAFKLIAKDIELLDITKSEKFGLLKVNYIFLRNICHPHDHKQRRMLLNQFTKYKQRIKSK